MEIVSEMKGKNQGVFLEPVSQSFTTDYKCRAIFDPLSNIKRNQILFDLIGGNKSKKERKNDNFVIF